MIRSLLLAAALCALSTAPAHPQTAPAPAPPAGPVHGLTAEQWREDLRFMAAEMERRHVNLFHTVSRETFTKAVADLDARIPTLQRHEIIVGMMRIAAMVGDGHTRVDPRKDARFGFPSLPLKLYLFEDGVYVRAAAPEYAALVGARIDAIGGVPIAEAIRRVGEISSRDNDMGLKFYAPLYLNMPDILHALGMSPRREAALLRLSRGGRTWTTSVPAGPVEPRWPPDTDISLVTPPGWADARTTAELPMWLQAPLDYHRMIELPEEKALYVQLNMLSDIPGQTLTQFAERIASRATATNPRALIVDLRLNHGGNGSLRTPLVRQLIKLEDADTRLFVLTWRGAYSATQFILDDLDRLTDAVFIGEPAGSKPSSFGDAYRQPMPNSRIDVRSSIVWWQAGQNKDPWTWVDVTTPYTFADYAAGRDPALEAALSHQPAAALHDLLGKAAASSGAAGARAALQAYRSAAPNRYVDLEQRLAAGAERLYNSGRRKEALIVAEIGVETFPDSVDTNNVLAHLAAAQGSKDVARRFGQRVLELDPNSRSARALLERLQGS